MNPANTHDMTAKVFMVGDFAVGKTNLLVRYCEGALFGQAPRNFEQKMKTVTVQGRRIRLVVWDTVEQERYKTVSSTSYKGCQGIIFCYAVNNRESFERLDYWMGQVNQHGGKDACKILVSTKCDLADHVVTADEGRRKAEEWGVEFFETSTNLDLNVTQAFESLATQIKVKYLDSKKNDDNNHNTTTLTNKEKAKEGGCCS